MTTRIDDALSIVGPELKSEVENIENELSMSVLEKSHFKDLVMKSVAEAEKEIASETPVEKASPLDVQDKDWNGVRNLFVGMFFKLATDNGIEVTEDELSRQIDKLLQGISAKSEATEEKPTVENTTEVAKTETVVEKIAVEIKEEDTMENSGVALEAVKAEVKELKDVVVCLVEQLKSEHRAASDEPAKIEKTETDYHSLSVVFDGLIKEALSKDTLDARKEGLQAVLNRMGDEFLTLTRIEEPTEKSDVTNQAVVRALVSEQISPVAAEQQRQAAQLNSISNALAQLLQAKSVTEQPPVSKAVVNLPGNLTQMGVQQTPKNGMYSISDIVKKTVY